MSRPADAYRREQSAGKKAETAAGPEHQGFHQGNQQGHRLPQGGPVPHAPRQGRGGARSAAHVRRRRWRASRWRSPAHSTSKRRKPPRSWRSSATSGRRRTSSPAAASRRRRRCSSHPSGKEKAEEILERVRKDMAPPPFTFLQDIDVHQAISLVRERVGARGVADPRAPGAEARGADPPGAEPRGAERDHPAHRQDPEGGRRGASHSGRERCAARCASMAEPVTEEVDGKAALTEILRYMDPAKEQAILADLEPNTANQIRKNLYTIDVVFQLPDKDLQRVMRDYADKELALVLRGAEEKTRQRMLASVSERRRGLIQMEEDVSGAGSKGRPGPRTAGLPGIHPAARTEGRDRHPARARRVRLGALSRFARCCCVLGAPSIRCGHGTHGNFRHRAARRPGGRDPRLAVQHQVQGQDRLPPASRRHAEGSRASPRNRGAARSASRAIAALKMEASVKVQGTVRQGRAGALRVRAHRDRRRDRAEPRRRLPDLQERARHRLPPGEQAPVAALQQAERHHAHPRPGHHLVPRVLPRAWVPAHRHAHPHRLHRGKRRARSSPCRTSTWGMRTSPRRASSTSRRPAWPTARSTTSGRPSGRRSPRRAATSRSSGCWRPRWPTRTARTTCACRKTW